MAGYQDILTDPSYAGQIVTMTYPHIGNYGVNEADVESARPWVTGFVVREAARPPSKYRSEGSLGDYLARNGIPGIAGIDTRALVRHVRMLGAMPAVLSTTDLDGDSLRRKAKAAPDMTGQVLVRAVSSGKAYDWKDGEPREFRGSGVPPTPASRVAAIDCGIKRNILRLLVDGGFKVERTVAKPVWPGFPHSHASRCPTLVAAHLVDFGVGEASPGGSVGVMGKI